MSKWVIDKTIEFCYGHRVWTQVLNGEYSDDLQCACRHLHGHEGKVQVHLTGDGLDPTGMVTDFRHLEWLKKWVNANVDHQFILDINDPLYDQLLTSNLGHLGIHSLYEVFVPGTEHLTGWKINLKDTKPGTPEYEYKEGFFIVDFVPTSENLSKWIAELVQVKMKPLNVTVDSIEWWETPKSRSIYYV